MQQLSEVRDPTFLGKSKIKSLYGQSLARLWSVSGVKLRQKRYAGKIFRLYIDLWHTSANTNTSEVIVLTPDRKMLVILKTIIIVEFGKDKNLKN